MAYALPHVARRISPHPVRMAGILYNIGNVLLFLTPVVVEQGVAPVATFTNNPLPPVAARLFFISGIIYSFNSFRAGNRLSAAAAVLLAIDLFVRGQLVASNRGKPICSVQLKAQCVGNHQAPENREDTARRLVCKRQAMFWQTPPENCHGGAENEKPAGSTGKNAEREERQL